MKKSLKSITDTWPQLNNKMTSYQNNGMISYRFYKKKEVS